MSSHKAKQKHQTPTASGTLAHIRIHGQLHQKHFPRGTDPLAIKEWLFGVEMRYRRPDSARTGRFDLDAKTYLAAVQAMPTFHERQQHIDWWAQIFRDRQRPSIRPDEIRAELHRLRAEHSASTCNHYRTALMHMYTVLDGKSAYNPVKDVPRFTEPSPIPKRISPAMIRKILAKLSGKYKARAMAIAYTGIPHAQLEQITEDDVDFRAGTVIVKGRRKGKGTATSIRPLTKPGLRAFRLMRQEKAFGPFDRWTFRHKVYEACEAAGVPEIRSYDLRHFFGTEVYRRSGDIRATQILMGHSTPQLTHRYTLAAVEPRVAAAVRKWTR